MWWTELALVVLWAADKHLLSKIWSLFTSCSRQAAWAGLTWYADYKQNNDMSKDGYHVDFVYLYEPTESGAYNEIDLLAHFRQQINMKTFSNTRSIDVKDFIELCCAPNSNFNNFDPSVQYELVVKYTFDYKQYIIVFDTTDNNRIRFPPYPEREIRQRSLKNTGVITCGMVTAAADADDGINVYEYLKKLAGPMENFYSDTEYTVKRHHLNYAGLKMDMDNTYIKMLDFWGTDFTITPQENVIRLEKK